ncbi:LPS export ABC transporter periplasmic protein LptC [Sphingomonas sp.]|uniref:LPS export ABC transporter periplasmic protein LptC n=1 Tax=Sphingomonas sp. TaxID=28214 RepID=UPI003B00C7AA
MSDAARADRRARRAWAAPGSSHDRVVTIARVGLPAAGLVLAVLLAVTPITSGREISFVLSKNRVDRAPERMKVTRALYRGEDNSGQPFALSAASAVQAHSADPVVKLHTLNARMGLSGGPAMLTAPGGDYDMANEKVALAGPVAFRSADGYRIDTRDVDLDMKTRTLASRSAVDGTMSLGRFRADRLAADLDKRTVVLTGKARLHIVQRSGKPPR